MRELQSLNGTVFHLWTPLVLSRVDEGACCRHWKKEPGRIPMNATNFGDMIFNFKMSYS